jgi:hypothetical protein
MTDERIEHQSNGARLETAGDNKFLLKTVSTLRIREENGRAGPVVPAPATKAQWYSPDRGTQYCLIYAIIRNSV